jgi:hypothetical protein
LIKKDNDEDSTDLEIQIDLMIYRLYELIYEEVKVVDEEFEMGREDYEGLDIQAL